MALITCTECGKQVSDQAGTCPHCGIAVAKPIPEAIPLESLMAKQREFKPLLERGEVLLIENVQAAYIKHMVNVDPGRAWLTNYRIVFSGKSGEMFMLLAAPVIAVMTAKAFPKIHLQIMLRDILSARIGRYGFSKRLIIETKSTRSYSLGLGDLPTWKSFLDEVQSAARNFTAFLEGAILVLLGSALPAPLVSQSTTESIEPRFRFDDVAIPHFYDHGLGDA